MRTIRRRRRGLPIIYFLIKKKKPTKCYYLLVRRAVCVLHTRERFSSGNFSAPVRRRRRHHHRRRRRFRGPCPFLLTAIWHNIHYCYYIKHIATYRFHRGLTSSCSAHSVIRPISARADREYYYVISYYYCAHRGMPTGRFVTMGHRISSCDMCNLIRGPSPTGAMIICAPAATRRV